MSTTPGYVSNAELASRLSTLVDRWNRRENQMIALLTQEEGTVVVTDGLGNNHTLPSFPQLQKDVAGLTDELTGSVVQVRDLVSVATGMANAAQASADDASGFADAAEASAVRAAESAASIDDDVQATADAATFAAAKAAEASDSATEAASSAVDAAASATASATSALASAGSASQAGTSATAAGQARSDAQAAATAAATSRDQAQTILGYATDAADRAEADATAAAASAAAAADSAPAAATSVTPAPTQANRAEAQASAAATKAGEAAGSATTAAGHASAASGSASAASISAQTASSAKAAAEAARDKAGLYANAPQGTEVSPGEFSAKHWAAQAQAAVTGSLVYMGSWDAGTGAFPANPVKGHFYKVVGEGTVGDIHWRVGDQALYGATWEKIDNTDQVTSVAGKQGDVTLVAGDIGGLGALATRDDVDFNTHVTGKPTTYPPSTHTHTKAQVGLDKVDNTADLDKPISTATQTALDGKAAATHTHTIANVSGLQSALDGKASLGGATFTGQVTLAYGAPLRLTGMGAAGTAYIHGTNGAGDDVCSITRVNTNSWYNLYWNGAANIAGRLTVGDQIYLNAGWFRSQQSGTGWYSEAHGGGIWMQDSTWVRTYGGKGFLIAGPGGSGGDLRLESYSPTITCYDSDNGTTHWLHCNDNNHGFLASNAFSWCAYRDGSNNWVATGNIVAYASDARLKKNIVDASASKVADFFDRFRVREFDWDAKAIAELNPTFHPSADHEVGGIAQEAEEVYSLMVATHANGIKTIQWEKAIPFLIAEVQALRKRVADLGGGA